MGNSVSYNSGKGYSSNQATRESFSTPNSTKSHQDTLNTTKDSVLKAQRTFAKLIEIDNKINSMEIDLSSLKEMRKQLVAEMCNSEELASILQLLEIEPQDDKTKKI